MGISEEQRLEIKMLAHEATYTALAKCRAELMIESAQQKQRLEETEEQLKNLSSDLSAKDRHITLLQSELKLTGRRVVL